MKLLSILRWTVLLALTATVIFLAIRFKNSPEASTHKIQQALVTEIKPAMELCTVEFIEDVPIKAHIEPAIFLPAPLSAASYPLTSTAPPHG